MRSLTGRFLSTCLVFGMLFGCKAENLVELLPDRLTLEAFSLRGEMISQQALDSSDIHYQRLKGLLEMRRDGWVANVTSYRTSPYVFRGGALIVRCYADLIVIDVTRSGHSASYKKKIPGLFAILGLS